MEKQKSYGTNFETVRRGYKIKLKIVLPLYFIAVITIIVFSNIFFR